MRCKDQRLIVETVEGLMKEPDPPPAQWQYNRESGQIEDIDVIDAIALVKRPPKRQRGLPFRANVAATMRDLSRAHARPPKR